MNIAIDVSPMAEFRTGTEEYIEGLVWGLQRAGVSVVGLGRPDAVLLPDKPGLGLPPRPPLTPWKKWWWETYGVRRVMPGTECLHIPYLAHPPVKLAVPTVVTVHDVIPFVLPEYRHSLREHAYFAQVRRHLPRADALVAISEATRRDIAEVMPELTERVTVILNGVHPMYFQGTEVQTVDQIVRRLGLRRHPRFLYVGGYDERKNVPLLIRAMRPVFEKLGDGELILVGARNFLPVHRVIADEKLQERVVLTPYLGREDLVALYQAADIFVFPSRYEGFGLPPAQALAMGVPVVAGNTPAVAEVVRDSAVLVPPDVLDDWVEALYQVAVSPALAHKLAAQGRIRAEALKWEAVARAYQTLYQRVIQGRR